VLLVLSLRGSGGDGTQDGTAEGAQIALEEVLADEGAGGSAQELGADSVGFGRTLLLGIGAVSRIFVGMSSAPSFTSVVGFVVVVPAVVTVGVRAIAVIGCGGFAIRIGSWLVQVMPPLSVGLGIVIRGHLLQSVGT
jgi:hypothetical protein